MHEHKPTSNNIALPVTVTVRDTNSTRALENEIQEATSSGPQSDLAVDSYLGNPSRLASLSAPLITGSTDIP